MGKKLQFSLSVMSDSLWPHESQHTRPPCPSPSPGVHSDSCPLSQWWHPAISSSVVPFSSYPQSLPASVSFSMSQLFTWGGQSIGVSALASVFPMNTQDWSHLEWTGWIFLQSKGLSRVFSNTTVQKHQFLSTQLSSCPWSQWWHPAISSSVIPCPSCPQSLPASESFPMSQLFEWGGQSIGVSALASVLPKNTQGLISFRMDWLDLLAVQVTLKSLLQKKHQFFGIQLSSQSNSHIHTWPLEKP